MSVESQRDARVEPIDGSPRLNRWVTGVALVLLGGLAALLFWPAHGLDTVERPEASLERVVTREMDLRAAIETAPTWERWLLGLVLSSDAEARGDAITWYEELVGEESSPVAELHRIVLLAEDGGHEETVQAALSAWTPTDADVARLAALARAAYEPTEASPAEFRAAIGAVRRELSPGWFADRLVARLGGRLGDPAVTAAADEATRARGTALLWRLRVILSAEILLVILGGVAVLGFARPPGLRAARVGAAPIPPLWSFGDGVGLFARGAVGLVGVAILWPLLPDRAWSSLLIAGLSAAPLLGYVVWYCRRAGLSVIETFGLGVSSERGGLARLVRVTLALVAVSMVGDVVLDLAGSRLRLGPHWTDGFQEELVWGAPGAVAVDVLDGCVFAPVLEEVLFRGLLYGTLRLRFGPGPATLVSAGLFALAHGYGAVGFASVLMSGVLWAVAYERTRSLLPGILAHAINNVQATAIVLATLRF
jgi:membrane protease YdiL (CAAX protease family)